VQVNDLEGGIKDLGILLVVVAEGRAQELLVEMLQWHRPRLQPLPSV
jgi:hypothetical protein